MNDYVVARKKDNSGFVIIGSFPDNAFVVEIPPDDPERKTYIDLFLHRADMTIGMSSLEHIQSSNDVSLNEPLFVAGLNSCMKCFKHSKARLKLDKNDVFQDDPGMLKSFLRFEWMRDKHYDHDENGMVQTAAFLFVVPKASSFRLDSPSVVWNRTKLDYVAEAKELKGIMIYVNKYLAKKIDIIGARILQRCASFSAEQIVQLRSPHITLATETTDREIRSWAESQQMSLDFYSRGDCFSP